MPRMTPGWKVREVRAMIAARKSQREIAALTGVSRFTIQRIGNTPIMPGERNEGNGEASGRLRPEERFDYDGNRAPERCPACGGKCYRPYAGWPCLACRVCRAKQTAYEIKRLKSRRFEIEEAQAQ